MRKREKEGRKQSKDSYGLIAHNLNEMVKHEEYVRGCNKLIH